MSKRGRKSKQPASAVTTAAESSSLKDTDRWSRGLSIASLIISLAAIAVSVVTARWGSAYFYASPSDLTYAYTQSNVRGGTDKPPSSNTTVAVYNAASTPARKIRVLLRPITAKPDIKCDQTYSIHKAPWGAVVVEIDRVPAKSSARLTILEQADRFPTSIEPWTRLKYQYAARIDSVETEFGSVQCDYDRCAMFLVPLPDDSNEPYVRHPSGINLQDIGKEPYPDAVLISVPKKDIELFDKSAVPVSPPPQSSRLPTE